MRGSSPIPRTILAAVRLGAVALFALVMYANACTCGVAPNIPPGANAVMCTCRCGERIITSIVCDDDPFTADQDCALDPVPACIPPDIGPNPVTPDAGLRQEDLQAICDRACDQGARPLAQNIQALTSTRDPCAIDCDAVVGEEFPDGGPPVGNPVLVDVSCADDAGVRPECEEIECPTTEQILPLFEPDAGPFDAGFDDAGDPVDASVLAVLKACTFTNDNPGNCDDPSRPTEPVCLAPNADPPVMPPIGFAGYLFGRNALGVIDPSSSELVVATNGGPDGGVAATPSGTLSFMGNPCLSSPCSLGVNASIKVAPLTLDFAVAGVPGSVDLTNVAVLARSVPGAVSVDETGGGVLQGTDVQATASAHAVPSFVGFSEQDVAFNVRPVDAVDVRVDYAAGTFSVAGAVETAENLLPPRPATRATFDIRGRLVARPPVADAGDDQHVECNAPGGAELLLDGSASADPDGDLIDAAWYGGIELTPSARIDEGLTISAFQPLGTQVYSLVVGDARRNIDIDVTVRSVADTTPPTLSDVVNNGPACLWAPEHDYVVLRAGQELSATVTDACDPAPALVIVSATSDQPDNGLGDGDTTNDVVVFPDRVCLRAERQGIASVGRTYAVHVVARDASGNEADPTFSIRVTRDQRDHDCPRLDAALFVNDGDPLCTAATHTADESVPAARAPATPNAETSDASSCASSGFCSPVAFLAWLLRRRRRKEIGVGSALIVIVAALGQVACAGLAPQSDEQLRECVTDVWLGATLACSCEDAGDAPECAADDCERRSFSWFRSDGTSVTGFIVSSATSKTFGTTAPPAINEQTIEAGKLIVTTPSGSSQSLPLRCSATEMVWGDSLLHRAPTGAASSFESAFDPAGWHGAAYLR